MSSVTNGLWYPVHSSVRRFVGDYLKLRVQFENVFPLILSEKGGPITALEFHFRLTKYYRLIFLIEQGNPPKVRCLPPGLNSKTLFVFIRANKLVIILYRIKGSFKTETLSTHYLQRNSNQVILFNVVESHELLQYRTRTVYIHLNTYMNTNEMK